MRAAPHGTRAHVIFAGSVADGRHKSLTRAQLRRNETKRYKAKAIHNIFALTYHLALCVPKKTTALFPSRGAPNAFG
jgi:hypothetical protein